jgi:hypothetical protein
VRIALPLFFSVMALAGCHSFSRERGGAVILKASRNASGADFPASFAIPRKATVRCFYVNSNPGKAAGCDINGTQKVLASSVRSEPPTVCLEMFWCSADAMQCRGTLVVCGYFAVRNTEPVEIPHRFGISANGAPSEWT